MMMLRRKRSTGSRMSGSACEFSERSVDALIGTCALHPSLQTALTRDLPLPSRRRLSSRVSCLLRLSNRQLLKLLSITCIPLPLSMVMTMIRARLARWNVCVCCLDWRTSICFSSSRLYPVVRSLGQLSLVFCKGFAMQFFAHDGFYQSLQLNMRVYTCMDTGSTVTISGILFTTRRRAITSPLLYIQVYFHRAPELRRPLLSTHANMITGFASGCAYLC